LKAETTSNPGDYAVISLVAWRTARAISSRSSCRAFSAHQAELGVSYAALGFATALFYALSRCSAAGGLRGRPLRRARRAAGGVGCLAAGRSSPGSRQLSAPGAGHGARGIGNSVFTVGFLILNARVGGPRLGYAYSAHGMAGSLGYASSPVFSGAMARSSAGTLRWLPRREWIGGFSLLSSSRSFRPMEESLMR